MIAFSRQQKFARVHENGADFQNHEQAAPWRAEEEFFPDLPSHGGRLAKIRPPTETRAIDLSRASHARHVTQDTSRTTRHARHDHATRSRICGLRNGLNSR